MSTIVRRPDFAGGGITDEEKRKLDDHTALWIKRAMRTAPIEPSKITEAVEGLYAAANLKLPRVVVVPSPFVMAMAGGAAAAIWHRRKNGMKTTATYDATDDATYDATYVATYDATDDATDDATRVATDDATRVATDDATRDATYVATDDATRDATRVATRVATYDATDDATYDATYVATYDATDDATRDATRVATYVATYDATYVATYVATDDATDDATRVATDDATYVATDDATRVATDDATRDATDDATRDATRVATDGLTARCQRAWWRMYQGGNMWAAYDAYLTAGRDVLRLNLPCHEHYKHWENAAIHGGFRIMHEEFCMVSDFPEILGVDENNQPHSETGPSHRWRDGFSIYHWHGTRVPAHWIESKETLDPTEVLRTENVEQRAAGAAIIGMANMLDALKHTIIDSHPDPQCGDLIEIWMPGLPDSELYLKFHCPRNGEMMEAINKRELPTRDLHHAHAWHSGVPAHLYSQPLQRS